MKRFILIAVAMLVVLSGTFIAAAQMGWTADAFVTAKLAAVRETRGGTAAVAVCTVALLASDLLLPVPSSVVMTLSGSSFGVGSGTAVSFVGAMLAAVIGFGACRVGGRRAFKTLVGDTDMSAVDAWFQCYGVYAIVLSRPVPMLTEILACMAGLTDLPARTFLAASALGTLPVCAVYAWFGAVSSPGNPWPAVLVSLLIPAGGWLAVRRIHRHHGDSGDQ